MLDDIRETIGAYAFHAQYLQNPRPGESSYLRIEDLNLIEALPELSGFTRRVQSWDMAVKDGPRSDYSAGITLGWHAQTETWHLLDVVRIRADYDRLKDRVLAERKRWRADKVLIEATALGAPLVQVLRKTARSVYLGITPTDTKVERFITQTDWLKAGHLAIPRSAPWFPEFIAELLAFPNDRHDDQVDALVQLIHWLRRQQGAYLDTDPDTGRRNGNYRPERPRREDRMRF